MNFLINVWFVGAVLTWFMSLSKALDENAVMIKNGRQDSALGIILAFVIWMWFPIFIAWPYYLLKIISMPPSN